MNLGVDPRHADQNVRGFVSLPNGTGKGVARRRPLRKTPRRRRLRTRAPTWSAADDLAEQVQKGVIDFDRVIATPDMMPVVGKLG